jgi:CRISPR-associated protein Cas5t
MITLHVEVPYASFRKSFARSFAETYPLPPPATVYGMLLSLVGEHFRKRHEGVRLAFAYKRMPRIATTLRKLSRFKYGTIENYRKLLKEGKDTRQMDFIETLCGIEFLCWVDSTQERPNDAEASKGDSLEQRLVGALRSPHGVERRGVLYLGLSDDAVNDVSLLERSEGEWHRLLPSDTGSLELPVWIDHVGSASTRWRRYEFEAEASPLNSSPGSDRWQWTQMVAPRTAGTN